MDDMRELLWSSVPKARNFIEGIVQDLVQGKNVLIHTLYGLPWEEVCFSEICCQVQLKNADKNFEYIDGIYEPGEALLQKFCRAEKRAEYRPGKGYAKFFAESDDIVLHSRYIWVTIPHSSNLESWGQFISDYYLQRSKGKECASFILQWDGELEGGRKRGIQIHSLEQAMDAYDCIVFTMLAVSELTIPRLMQCYLSELTATILQDDLELCAACLHHYDKFLENPFLEIQHIVTEKARSNGCPYSFEKTENAVRKDVWKSQLKTIYPILEECREEFVQKKYQDILQYLPISSPYGGYYETPNEIEYGTLVYMASNQMIQLSDSEYQWLIRFRNARNKLAHLNPLSIEEIRTLFDIESKIGRSS